MKGQGGAEPSLQLIPLKECEASWKDRAKGKSIEAGRNGGPCPQASLPPCLPALGAAAGRPQGVPGEAQGSQKSPSTLSLEFLRREGEQPQETGRTLNPPPGGRGHVA